MRALIKGFLSIVLLTIALPFIAVELILLFLISILDEGDR